MFVQNCAPDFGQELAVPHSQDVKQGGQRRRRKKNKGMTETEKSDGISCESTKGAASVNTKYYGVKCDVCRTQVAVYDQDEVYHFFNVLASHS